MDTESQPDQAENGFGLWTIVYHSLPPFSCFFAMCCFANLRVVELDRGINSALPIAAVVFAAIPVVAWLCALPVLLGRSEIASWGKTKARTFLMATSFAGALWLAPISIVVAAFHWSPVISRNPNNCRTKNAGVAFLWLSWVVWLFLGLIHWWSQYAPSGSPEAPGSLPEQCGEVNNATVASPLASPTGSAPPRPFAGLRAPPPPSAQVSSPAAGRVPELPRPMSSAAESSITTPPRVFGSNNPYRASATSSTSNSSSQPLDMRFSPLPNHSASPSSTIDMKLASPRSFATTLSAESSNTGVPSSTQGRAI